MPDSGKGENRDTCRAALERLEDLADLRIAEQRLRACRDGKEDTVPLEEVMRRHGMEAC